MNIILSTIFGSHLYGSNTDNSDLDFKSIYIPSANDILLQKIKTSIQNKRNKPEFEKNNADDIDEEIYSLDKFFSLVSEGQTVSLDVLFSNPDKHLITSDIWKEISDNRKRLISRKSEAFIGYCRQQANKYGIKGSRVAAARKAYEVLGALVGIYGKTTKLCHFENDLKYLVEDEFCEFESKFLANGQEIKHLSVCGRLMPFTSSVGSAYDIVKRLFDEYGKRALQAENNDGVDWKALSHAVRIGQQAIELFETHNIIFPRPNAHELVKIKKGELPYKEVAELIEELFIKVEGASKNSTLPEKADSAWIESFILDKYSKVIYDKCHTKGVFCHG